MPIEVQVFLYVRNKLFCTKLLYFMPDARGCRAHARMPRTRADAARTRGCRARIRTRGCRVHALLSVEQAFLLQLQSSRISLIMSIEVQSFLM